MPQNISTAIKNGLIYNCSVVISSLGTHQGDTGGHTCILYTSSGCSNTMPSVRMTRLPVSLEVWEDSEEVDWRTEPSRLSGLQRERQRETGTVMGGQSGGMGAEHQDQWGGCGRRPRQDRGRRQTGGAREQGPERKAEDWSKCASAKAEQDFRDRERRFSAPMGGGDVHFHHDITPVFMPLMSKPRQLLSCNQSVSFACV